MWELGTRLAGDLGLSAIQVMNDQKQKPLTLALSQRERGLTELFGRSTPTCDTKSNSGFEKPNVLLPFPLAPLGERAGVRGKLLIWPLNLSSTQFLAAAT